MTEPYPEAWPPYSLARIADAVDVLASRVEPVDVRAQLHALAAVLRNVGGETAGAQPQGPEVTALDAALAAQDEAGVIAAVRTLAAVNRAAVVPVDWSKASGG